MWKWNSIFSRKLNNTEKADKHISGRKYDRTKEAAVEAIRTCRDRDALKDYLNEREKEVVDIMIALFDQEYAVKQYGNTMKQEGEGKAESRMGSLIPEGCTSIGAKAFKDCANLTQIRIPASVTSIDTTAFEGCEKVLVYGTADSAAQTFCADHANCTFVAEN